MKRLLVFLLLMGLCYIVDINVFDMPSKNTLIKVEVRGEVINEGIYEVENYTTIKDLLDLAILKDEADISGINLNNNLHDKDVIFIPKVNNNEIKISINTSNIESLIMIPGIGESTAKKIIEYRDEYGFFNSLEEIKNVKGIGDKKYEKIKDHIRL